MSLETGYIGKTLRGQSKRWIKKQTTKRERLAAKKLMEDMPKRRFTKGWAD